MARRKTLLDTPRTFLASGMELVALGNAIHFYINAAQRKQLSKDKQKQVVPLLQSFQSRLVEQLEGSNRNDGI